MDDTTGHKGYSGGGSDFEMADFVILKSAQSGVGIYEEFYKTIPFFCSRLTRGYFSEEEYKKFPHCVEEIEGYLKVAFSQEK